MLMLMSRTDSVDPDQTAPKGGAVIWGYRDVLNGFADNIADDIADDI